jgi:hypothetical protein
MQFFDLLPSLWNLTCLGTAKIEDFALQPGGGVDFRMTPTLALRFGGDYRRIFSAGWLITKSGFRLGLCSDWGNGNKPSNQYVTGFVQTREETLRTRGALGTIAGSVFAASS